MISMRVSAVFNRLALSLITLVRASTSMSLVQPSNTVNAVKQPNLYTIRLAKVEDIPYTLIVVKPDNIVPNSAKTGDLQKVS